MRRHARTEPVAQGTVRTVRIRVDGGYDPSVVRARVGEPLRLVFSRQETAAGSEYVVFPEFGKAAMLPPFVDVVVDLVPEHAGESEFTCQLGMLRGRLVVEDGPLAAMSARNVAKPFPWRLGDRRHRRAS